MLDIINRHFASFSAGNWTDYKADLAQNAVYEEQPTMQRAKGVDAFVKAAQVWKRGFPDLKANVLSAFVSGDNKVFAELEWEGTHTAPLEGPFGTIPPTNKRGSVRAASIFTLENGKITEVRHYFDLLTVLRQLGVAPGVGAPAAEALPAAEPSQRR